MAESKIDSNSFNLNEELLRDSLEIDEELCDNFYSASLTKSNRTESQKSSPKDSDVLSLNGQVAMVSTVDTQDQNCRANKTQLVKPKSKNMIEFNKVNIAKYRTKTSYCKLHEKKLGRAILIEKKDENSVDQGVSNPSLSSVAIELQKQFVLDGILTEKNEDIRLCHQKYEVEETNQSHNRFGDQHKVESTRSSESIMPHLGTGYHVEESSITNDEANSNSAFQYMPRNIRGGLQSYVQDEGSQPQLPLIDLARSPKSVQSAPADLQEHQDLFHEKSSRSHSICALQSEEAYDDQLNNFTTTLASTKPVSAHRNYITYSSIFANTKQNGRTNYKPYTLGDYKRLKKQSKPGGLGPDTKSEQHQQKAKKAFRQKEYSVAVKQRNTSANFQAKRKNTSSTNNNSDQKQEANARRIKAMEYAKAIRKPITSKSFDARKSPTQAVEEPRTFLSILQQRHEDEKKAIEAMRKNLQAKLKTR